MPSTVRKLLYLCGLLALCFCCPVSYAQTVATPTFSQNTQGVVISTLTGGAVLCYTTDGTTPTESGNLCSGGTTKTYSVPLIVWVSTVIKVLGTKSGDTDSTVASGTFLPMVIPAVMLQ